MSEQAMDSSNDPEEPCVDCQPLHHGQNGSETTHAVAQSSVTDTILPPQQHTLLPSLLIEFCDRCRWNDALRAPRATWIQTELFLTFPTPIIRSSTLQPLTAPEMGGRFRVWLQTEQGVHLIWDRKTEGGFPELRVLKQRVRNIVQPDLNLGHSDVKSKQAKVDASTA